MLTLCLGRKTTIVFVESIYKQEMFLLGILNICDILSVLPDDLKK